MRATRAATSVVLWKRYVSNRKWTRWHPIFTAVDARGKPHTSGSPRQQLRLFVRAMEFQWGPAWERHRRTGFRPLGESYKITTAKRRTPA